MPRELVSLDRVYRMNIPMRSFRDFEFDKNKKFIYALACVDAHGLTSNYSVQMEISFNRRENKLVRKLISRSGAPKPYPNAYLNRDLFIDSHEGVR